MAAPADSNTGVRRKCKCVCFPKIKIFLSVLYDLVLSSFLLIYVFGFIVCDYCTINGQEFLILYFLLYKLLKGLFFDIEKAEEKKQSLPENSEIVFKH